MALSTPDTLQQSLSDLPKTDRYLVAFSGGIDSIVLLHTLVALRDQIDADLVAVHVNHGLQSESGDWAAWCSEQCKTYEIPFVQKMVSVNPSKGESMEAVARHVRYEALAEEMQPGDVLLTAHHQNDQAETLLLHLLRGAGTAGLAAMPVCREFAPGYLARPLLSVSRSQIYTYAEKNGLAWIEDPSNSNLSIERNYLRHRVIPMMEEHWPGFAVTLSRSAAHCAEADYLLGKQARSLLEQVLTEHGTLQLHSFVQLNLPQRRLVMRAWLQGAGAPVPNHRKMERLCKEIVDAGRDRQPKVEWADVVVRRFCDELHLIRRELLQNPQQGPYLWGKNERMVLPGNGELCLTHALGGLNEKLWRSGRVEVGYRQGGERCKPLGRGLTKSVKSLLQEHRVAPWLRQRQPLVFLDGELAAIPGLCVCESIAVASDQVGLLVDWKKPKMVYTS